jgi:hypothetical protein
MPPGLSLFPDGRRRYHFDNLLKNVFYADHLWYFEDAVGSASALRHRRGAK